MRLPKIVRRHHEAVKFLLVGGVCFLVTTVINYALKLTVLSDKPVTALALATIIATILSYVLNREWSFRTRGGRERHHEAALFFSVSAVGVVLNSVPLYVSRYVFLLQEPDVSRPVQEIADFVSGIVIGTLIAMCFRLWAFKRFVFPHSDARPHRRRSRGRTGPRRAVVQHEPPARDREAPSRDLS
ncbi:Putative flippase GtrA (transmembrane translocase of bactoprenol-linked glucose) [Actinoplanes philippinensis]|uniref:Putative flippase GtrA (Transmembrane translocase of bactoprenol-linked glucose) n=1 Tax=Actinoplanes philippinensis TaxID=35752 RepID=A0A1I2G1X3_9ACTN|nr:GtrA family protein [Actinoplanes philippinensis]SFF11542.1 Putative flippase GtrA (transmembrane translocase of bactoprenol-linked glucose) [Actinoplanes philippinensis]